MLGATLLAPVAALAAQATDSDVRGKKICWDDKTTTVFGKDGSWDNSHWGHGTWSLGGALTVTLSSSKALAPATASKEDGVIHLLRRGTHGNIVERVGKYCN